MNRFLFFVMFLCTLSFTTFSQSFKEFKDQRNVFSVFIPDNWNNGKPDERTEFVLASPAANGNTITVETNRLPAFMENYTLKKLAKEQEKEFDENGVSIVTKRYLTINGTEWYLIDYNTQKSRYQNYQTIYNKTRYCFYYYGSHSNFEVDEVVAWKAFNSFVFHHTGITVANPSPALTAQPAQSTVASKKVETQNRQQATDLNPPELTSESNRRTSSNETPNCENETVSGKEKSQRTYVGQYGYVEGDEEMTEQEIIKLYGKGKIRRLSRSKLEVTIAGSKKKLIDIKAQNENTSAIIKFLGYDDNLNSYIFQLDDGAEWYGLINRTTGAKTEIPHAFSDAEFSPDKKVMVFSDLYDYEHEQLVVYIISPVALKQVFAQPIQTETSGWEAGRMKWLSNTVVEIEKIKREEGKEDPTVLGHTWLTLANGKWVLTNSKPVVSPANSPSASVSTPNDAEKANPVFAFKIVPIDLTPNFSGSIVKRWQVAGVKQGPYLDYKSVVIEFEFLPGGRYNAYEDKVIQSSGDYVLATDKGSVLLKEGRQSAPMRILRLAPNQAVFLAAGDTMISYPVGSVAADEIIAKRLLKKKSGRDWFDYWGVTSRIDSFIREVFFSEFDSHLKQDPTLKKLLADNSATSKYSKNNLHRPDEINALFLAVKNVRTNIPAMISLIESDAGLMKKRETADNIAFLRKLSVEWEEQEKAALRFLNAYYK